MDVESLKCFERKHHDHAENLGAFPLRAVLWLSQRPEIMNYLEDVFVVIR